MRSGRAESSPVLPLFDRTHIWASVLNSQRVSLSDALTKRNGNIEVAFELHP